MRQRDPARSGGGTGGLFGATLARIAGAGGKIRGILWYQGEGDTIGNALGPEHAANPSATASLLAAFRARLGVPDLPFYLVQIGRYVSSNDPWGWNGVRETQRLLSRRVPNTRLVSAIDGVLFDTIHLSAQGARVVGRRLALVALRDLYGKEGATPPDFAEVVPESGVGGQEGLRVRFSWVNPGLGPESGLQPRWSLTGSSVRDAGGEVIPQGSRWIAGWCEQEANQGLQEPPSTGPDIVDELEEAQVQRQALLRDPPMGTEPRAEQ